MRTTAFFFLLLALGPSCAYVTTGEFDEAWDKDGDGWPLDEDCNDNNPSIYPGAPDIPGDGCDSDCGYRPDADGDDWPDYSDCAPDDPTIYPWAPDIDGDGIDSDCDGLDSPRTDPWPGIDPENPDVTSIDCSGAAEEEA